jgi:hypothetical protein
MTTEQTAVVNKLQNKGWITNLVSPDSEGECIVYMSKRITKYSTRYAEVDEQGLVNGEEFEPNDYARIWQ